MRNWRLTQTPYNSRFHRVAAFVLLWRRSATVVGAHRAPLQASYVRVAEEVNAKRKFAMARRRRSEADWHLHARRVRYPNPQLEICNLKWSAVIDRHCRAVTRGTTWRLFVLLRRYPNLQSKI
ncbi:MAG: hypothetical protein DMF25_05220 [Verrucomicrobia bacterium]|nr:MAG: hypothetical protein DMF25_05220 [Verrucomicrobiota bacterium]